MILKLLFVVVVLVHLAQADPFLRTRIRIKANRTKGEDMFVLGGLDLEQNPECPKKFVESNTCIMPIRHNVPQNLTLLSKEDRQKYQSWSFNDKYLDWFGAEANQGKFKNLIAGGTPMFFLPLNATNSTSATKGNKVQQGHYVAEFELDCARTHGAQHWFEYIPVKRLANGQFVRMEKAPYGPVQDLYSGTSGLVYFPPYDAGNYWGICGRSSTSEWNVPGTRLSALVLTHTF